MIGADSFKICAAAIIAALCISIVKRINPGFDMPLKLSAAVVFFGLALGSATPLFRYLLQLVDSSDLSSHRGVIFGAFGIAMVCHTTAELCRECGEPTVASYVELTGKIEILLLCLPMVSEIIREVEGLVS